ncbi:hypothetical protein V8B97DRAFT_528174 [Scleroderma yunnanense]
MWHSADLCPPKYPDQSSGLTSNLQHRFQEQASIYDLDEAIELFQAVSKLYPPESRIWAYFFHMRANCLWERYQRQGTTDDLDKAFNLETAAVLCPPHCDINMTFSNLTTFFNEQKSRAMASPEEATPPSCGIDLTKKAIEDVVFEVLNGVPPQLLNTSTGVLCDRKAQLSHFENSKQYNQLLSWAIRDDSLQIEDIRAVVSTYFWYVMLSHRWDQCKPKLQEVESHRLEATGIAKLQEFCLRACKRGYV